MGHTALLNLGWKMGLEPTASRATTWRSNQLSYIHRRYVFQIYHSAQGKSSAARLECRRKAVEVALYSPMRTACMAGGTNGSKAPYNL